MCVDMWHVFAHTALHAFLCRCLCVTSVRMCECVRTCEYMCVYLEMQVSKTTTEPIAAFKVETLLEPISQREKCCPGDPAPEHQGLGRSLG